MRDRRAERSRRRPAPDRRGSIDGRRSPRRTIDPPLVDVIQSLDADFLSDQRLQVGEVLETSGSCCFLELAERARLVIAKEASAASTFDVRTRVALGRCRYPWGFSAEAAVGLDGKATTPGVIS